MSEPHPEMQQSNGKESDEPVDDGSGVGALLQASRLRIGEDLRDVADVLRIRYRYLEDIEAGRYHALPGTTYAIGFIRTYADHLGLDGEEVVRRFKEEVAASQSDENLEFPAPIGESGIPAGAVVFVGLIIAVLAYGAWYVSTTEKGFFAEFISPIPERLAKILPDDEKATIESTAKTDSSKTESKTPEADQTLATAVSALSGTTSTDKAEAEPQTSASSASSSEAMPSSDAAETATDQTSQSGEAMQDSNAAMESAQQAAMNSPAPAMAPAPAPATTETPVETATDTPKIEDVKKEVAAASSPQEPEKTVVATTAPEKKPDDNKPAPKKEEEKIESKPVALTPEPAPETTPAPQTPTAPEPETASQAPSQTAPQVAVNIPAESSTPKGRVYGVENTDARIIVRAKKNSWIQVRDDVANKLLLTRLLRQGDSYRVPNREGLKLLAGNAGALEILVDGKSVPAIGPQGAVRRSVSLDAKRLVEGKAVIE